MSEELKEYLVTPSYKKSTYSNELWTNTINNKNVTMVNTVMWRRGEFIVKLYDKEYEELLEEDNIIINDHSGEFISTDDGCERTVEIKDIEKYSEEEKKEIYDLIYEDVEDEILLEDDVLEEEKGWMLDDTIYEIYGGFELELQE
tara:strand:- start:4376 stop:4810 length:435 start_codon:yes stop_codon:yes gene_type:complete